MPRSPGLEPPAEGGAAERLRQFEEARGLRPSERDEDASSEDEAARESGQQTASSHDEAAPDSGEQTASSDEVEEQAGDATGRQGEATGTTSARLHRHEADDDA